MPLRPTCLYTPVSYLRLLFIGALLVLLALFQGCDASQPDRNSKAKLAPASAEYVGSEACGQCHQAEFNLWKGSHHELAMNKATEQSVLGDFGNIKVTYQNRMAHFFKADKQFFVTTDNALGQSQTFEITDTFGIEPLQQYLVKFPRGRKQVLDIAWDSRDKSLGGQTWFFINSDHGLEIINDEKINNTSPLEHIKAPQPIINSATENSSGPLHWTSSFYNWNSRCASCHTTGFNKNYDDKTDNYNSQFTADNVGCEACHGQGKQHIKWARGDTEKNIQYNGFQYSLKDTGVWDVINEIAKDNSSPEEIGKGAIRNEVIDNIAKQTINEQSSVHRAPSTKMRTGLSSHQQITACAGCHSRRLQLGQHQEGEAFTDNYLPMLIEEPLYHDDGQIKDEVFVWGSFTQSKMFQAGVVCSSCHNAHSLKLKITGNGLCTQCHSPSVYDNNQHHKHTPTSSGAQCVNCHMPSTTYMNVDDRRDHSFQIPRPDLSKEIDSPDACTNCHTNKNQDWAGEKITELFGHNLKPHVYAKPFFKAQLSHQTQTKQLLHLANNPILPAIIRASAWTHIGNHHTKSSVKALQDALKNESAVIRLGAVRSLSTLPNDLRLELLDQNLNEKSMAVRVEMARQLAAINLSKLKLDTRKKIKSLFSDLISAARYDADTPENQIILGNFYLAQNHIKKAIKHFQSALALEPHFQNALLNLADLYRGKNEDHKALPLLKEAISHHGYSSYPHYALGLLYIRQSQLELAIENLRQATQLDSENISYAYAYILALMKVKNNEQAGRVINNWQLTHGQEDRIEKLRKSL
ncbi:MAG: multiheme c-type cytochrome [Bermanella sp.]